MTRTTSNPANKSNTIDENKENQSLNLTNTTDTIQPICPICHGEILEDSQAVSCDNCELWYHRTCSKITIKLYNKISDAPSHRPVQWHCYSCKKTIKAGLNQSKPATSTNQTLDPNLSHTPEVGLICSTQCEDVNRKKLQQQEAIIEILMQDIDDLKSQLKAKSDENNKLSDRLAIKMEVVYKLEKLIHDLTQNTKSDQNLVENKPPRPKTTNSTNLWPTLPTLNQSKLGPLKTGETSNDGGDAPTTNDIYHHPTPPENENILLIGDSIIAGAANLLRHKGIRTHVIPGGRIADLSRYLNSVQTLPDFIYIHIGTNNLPLARNANQIMRPLWMTIEANKKRSPHTLWVVNGILFRKDLNTSTIVKVNDAIKFMTEQLKIGYSNPSKSIHPHCYGRDGLHLNKIGAQKLARAIERTIHFFTHQPKQRPQTRSEETPQKPNDKPNRHITSETTEHPIEDTMNSSSLNKTMDQSLPLLRIQSPETSNILSSEDNKNDDDKIGNPKNPGTTKNTSEEFLKTPKNKTSPNAKNYQNKHPAPPRN